MFICINCCKDYFLKKRGNLIFSYLMLIKFVESKVECVCVVWINVYMNFNVKIEVLKIIVLYL